MVSDTSTQLLGTDGVFFDAAWDVRITDTSLRDGSHHKRHQFTADEVRAIVAALDGAGVPVIEVTHGDGLGGSSFNYGFSKTPEQELIKLAAETATNAKIAFLMLPGVGTKEDIIEAQGNGGLPPLDALADLVDHLVALGLRAEVPGADAVHHQDGAGDDGPADHGRGDGPAQQLMRWPQADEAGFLVGADEEALFGESFFEARVYGQRQS